MHNTLNRSGSSLQNSHLAVHVRRGTPSANINPGHVVDVKAACIPIQAGVNKKRSHFGLPPVARECLRPLQALQLPNPPPDDNERFETCTTTPADVDQELWEVLELCSMEELEEVYNCLFGSSPLSPIVKSIVTENEPAAGRLRGRSSLMRVIDQRFRFLAADAGAMIRGRRPSYRESLLSVRDRLSVDCPSTLRTSELEAEIYMHMLDRYDTSNDSHNSVKKTVNAFAVSEEGDGMAPPPQSNFIGKGWAAEVERVVAPIKLGGKELLPSLANLMSAVGVSSMRSAAMRRVGATLLGATAKYEAAVGAAATTARIASIKASQKGVATAAAQFGAVRGATSLLGPIMWAAFAAELALMSIGTDYGRVVRCIFVLSQVRLVHTHGWTNGNS